MASANNPGTDEDVLFDALIDDIKDLLGAVPQWGVACRDALRASSQAIAAAVANLEADTKAHPSHKAGNDQQITQLTRNLARALVNYTRCIHLAAPMRVG